MNRKKSKQQEENNAANEEGLIVLTEDELVLMNRKDSKLQEDNVAAREKGLLVAREFDRLVRAFNKVLKYKENCAKCLETDLQALANSLQDNLDDQNALNRNFEIFDSSNEKVILNLQKLEDEEKTSVVRYERLLRGIAVKDDTPESENIPAPGRLSAEEEYDLDNLKTLKTRRESFFKNLDQEFKKLEEKLGSIENLKSELEKSRNDLRQKTAQALEEKETLEDQGKKLLNKVGKLEIELETTVREETKLIEEFVKVVRNVGSGMEVNENINQVMASFLTLAESPDAPQSPDPMTMNN